jgi:hypothetical protein
VKKPETKKKTWTPPKTQRMDLGQAENGDSILGDSSLVS